MEANMRCFQTRAITYVSVLFFSFSTCLYGKSKNKEKCIVCARKQWYSTGHHWCALEQRTSVVRHMASVNNVSWLSMVLRLNQQVAMTAACAVWVGCHTAPWSPHCCVSLALPSSVVVGTRHSQRRRDSLRLTLPVTFRTTSLLPSCK